MRSQDSETVHLLPVAFASPRMTGCHGNLSAGSACWLPSQDGSSRLSAPLQRPWVSQAHLVLDSAGWLGPTHSEPDWVSSFFPQQRLGSSSQSVGLACTSCSKVTTL